MNCQPVVDLADIQRAYPLIADGCLRVSEREGEPFFAPTLYAEIMAGHWVLFVVKSDQGEPVGVFICRKQIDTRSSLGKLFVLLAYTVPGVAAALETGFAACKRYAAQLECSHVQFASKRMGWARRAQQLGYKPAQQLYEIEVQP
jgi:hypothetical protein